jgi:hypothetical protein
MDIIPIISIFIFSALLFYTAIKWKIQNDNKYANAITARVVKVEPIWDTGVYHSRTYQYNLTIEYISAGAAIQKTIPSMEHFPENSTIKIIPRDSRIEVLSRTPAGPIQIKYDIILCSIAMFIAMSGFNMLFEQWNVNPLIANIINCIPFILLACLFSWIVKKKNKQIENYNNSCKAKVIATAKEHRLERRHDHMDKVHTIMTYEYNQLFYQYDHISNPLNAPQLNSCVELNVDSKTGYVINIEKTKAITKILNILSYILWFIAGFNLVTVFLTNL